MSASRAEAAVAALLGVEDEGRGLDVLLGVNDPVGQRTFDKTGSRTGVRMDGIDVVPQDIWTGDGFVVEGLAYGEGGPAGIVILGKGGKVYALQEYVGTSDDKIAVNAVRNAPSGKPFTDGKGGLAPSVPVTGRAVTFNASGDFGVVRDVTFVGDFTRAGRGSDGKWRVGEVLGTLDGVVIAYGSRTEDGKSSIIQPEELSELLGLRIPSNVFSRLPELQVI